MALKKKSNSNSKIEALRKEIMAKNKELLSLKSEISKLEEELLSLEIQPFKLGDYAYAELQIGRTKKECKCLLECENGILYLRPLNNNGELSGRHFSFIPIGKPYSSMLRKVED